MPHVMLLLPTGGEFIRGLVHGVSAYHQPRRPWRLHFCRSDQGVLEEVSQDPPAGVIFSSGERKLLTAIKRWGVPVINCGSGVYDPDVPTFAVDNVAVGQQVAEFLMGRGHINLACCGVHRRRLTVDRCRGFREAVRAAGRPCYTFFQTHRPPQGDRAERFEAPDAPRLTRWLRSLPKPVGVLASTDAQAQLVSDLCTSIGLHVPEQVAVLGVDNNESLCEAASPTLSSVALPTETIGLRAAECLDRLMEHEQAALPEPRWFGPLGVVTRQSTGDSSSEDPHLTTALRYIEAHADRPIRVRDVMSIVPLSRRALEMRFERDLGRGILQQIQHTHIERAKRLLRETDHVMDRVAEGAGFNSRERLRTVFQQMTGQNPSEYRKMARIRSPKSE